MCPLTRHPPRTQNNPFLDPVGEALLYAKAGWYIGGVYLLYIIYDTSIYLYYSPPFDGNNNTILIIILIIIFTDMQTPAVYLLKYDYCVLFLQGFVGGEVRFRSLSRGYDVFSRGGPRRRYGIIKHTRTLTHTHAHKELAQRISFFAGGYREKITAVINQSSYTSVILL